MARGFDQGLAELLAKYADTPIAEVIEALETQLGILHDLQAAQEAGSELDDADEW